MSPELENAGYYHYLGGFCFIPNLLELIRVLQKNLIFLRGESRLGWL